MKHTAVIRLVFVAVTLTQRLVVEACSCIGPITVPSTYRSTSGVVFQAVVIRELVTECSKPAVPFIAPGETIPQIRPNNPRFCDKIYIATVTQTFKNCPPQSKIIYINAGSPALSCNISFQTPQSYLLFATLSTSSLEGFRSRPVYNVNFCAPNKPWSSVTQEEENFLFSRISECDGQPYCTNGREFSSFPGCFPSCVGCPSDVVCDISMSRCMNSCSFSIDDAEFYDANTFETVDQCPEAQIFLAAIGRPFVDSNMKQLQADTIHTEKSVWANKQTDSNILYSQPQHEDDILECHNNDENKLHSSSSFIVNNETYSVMPQPSVEIMETHVPVTIAKKSRREMSSSWAHRALGEHASVASFAVFVLNLMTNKAPPDLIRDALYAALDEVNHATTSFEVASLLLSAGATAVEPGALPPSSHHMKEDITSLALSTAREGCVEETLSALIIASESMHHVFDASDNKDEEVSVEEMIMLSEKLSGIALDEARHSSLAWRTIAWVCREDNAACKIVKEEVLDEVRLLEVGRRLSSMWMGDDLEKGWKSLYEKLVPFVINGGNKGEICDTKETDVGVEDGWDMNVVERTIDKIIEGVVCA